MLLSYFFGGWILGFEQVDFLTANEEKFPHLHPVDAQLGVISRMVHDEALELVDW